MKKGEFRVARCKPPKDRPYDTIGFDLKSDYGDSICFTVTPDEALEIAAKAVLAIADFLIADPAYQRRFVLPRTASTAPEGHAQAVLAGGKKKEGKDK